MSKRITSLFLVLALCLTLLPTAALAAEQPEAVNSTAVQAATAEKTESSVASVVIDGTTYYYDTLREAIMAAGEKAGSDGTPPAITLLQDGGELRYPQYNSAEKRDDPTYPVIVDMGGNSLSSVYFLYGTLTLTGGTVNGTWGADLRSGGSLIMTAPEDAEAAVSGPLKITNISGQVGTANVSGAKIGVKGTLRVESSAANAVVISGSEKAVELDSEAYLSSGGRFYGSTEENGSPDTVAVFDAGQKTYMVDGVTAKTLVSGPKAVVAVTPGDTLSVMAGEAQEYTAQFTAEGVVTGSVKGLGDLQATVENGDANGITVNVAENAADGTWKVTVQTAESTPLDTYTLNLSSAVDGAVSGSVQFKVSETKYAASVNGTNYRSLSAAIDAAKNVNGTVTLLDNVTDSVTVTEGNKFTIDLNGKTWTGASNSRALTVDGGEVTVSSTGGAGTIVGSDTNKYAVRVDGGTVHLKENVNLKERLFIQDENGGSVTFEPGVTVTKNIMTDSRSVVRFLDGLALQNASKAYVPFHGVFTNEYPLGYVTVVAHPDHSMADGVCDQCGYVCGHSRAKADDTVCPDCGAAFIADATAADGTVTRYTNADAALAAAAGSAKVTFVPGTYTLKNAVSFSGRIETEIDLNGATLQYASGDQGVVLLITESYENITITLKNGTVQNTGEGTGIGLYSNTKNSARSALTLENVTVIGGVDTFNMRQAAVCVAKNNTLTVKSGSFSGPLDLNLAESTVKLYGGTYQNGITGSMYRDGGWQYELSAEDYAALLDNSDPAKQYAYADGANGAVISYATVAERMNDRDDTNNSIRVVAHEHTMNDSACTQCGFVCTAHQYKNGVCAICHAECPHTDATCNAEIWTCDACGLTMAVKIQTDTNTRHFTSLKDALAAAENGQTVTLLDNIDQSNKTACLTGDSKTVTLNLNGKNITGGWIDVGRDQDGTVINSSRLNITGSGSFDGMIGISAKGTLDLSGWDGGTIKTVDLSKSGDDECTLIVGEKAGTIQTLQIYNWPTDKSGSITYINNTELRGGSYNNIPITMKSEDGAARYIPYGSILAAGYAFQYTDSGAFVDYAAKAEYSGGGSLSNVKVVRCTSHVDANSDNHCDYCNTDLTTGVAATLETGGATYYYTDLPSALKAASSKGGTVTLQKDVENVSQMLVIEGSLHVTLDLNGKKIIGNGSSTLLGISNLSDVTICDSSESKVGQIKCTASGYAVYVSEGCDLTISGGTFEGTDDATTSAPGYAVGVDGAKLIITGGTFNGAVTINARGATITGGTFNGAFSMSAQPDVFSGGTFTQQAVFSSVSNILTGGEFQKGIKSTDKKLYELLAENKAYQTAPDWLDDITTYLCSDTGSSVTVTEAPIHSVTLTVNDNPVALEDHKGCFSVELGTDVTLTASCEGSMEAPYGTWSPSLGGEDGGTGNPVKQGTGKSLSYTLPSKDLTVGTHTYRVSFCSEDPGSIGQVTGYYKVAQITITVTPRDLKNATVEYFTTNNPTVVTYNPLNNHICGLPIYEVTLDGVELEEGTDYIISGNTAAEVGKYTAILTAKSDSTKCKGTLKIEWEVVPYALPEPSFEGSQTYTKIYDGTTNLPKEYKFQALFLAKEPGSSEVDWREDEFKDNYEVTSAEFVSPDAGENKPINQTITLKNENFVFAPTIKIVGITTTDKTITYKNFTLSEAYPTLGTTFSIKKATMPDFDKEVTLEVINDLENTYTIDLPALPALESPRTYGDTQYEVDQSSVKALTQGYNAIQDVGFAVNPDNGETQLTFHAPAVENQTEGSVGAIQITVTPTNYKPVTLIVNLQSVNKRKLGIFVSVATDPVVYGMTLGDIKLSAEATDGSQVIPGTIAWEDPLTTVPAAGQATYRWTFTPDDTVHYLSASNTIHFSVDKATPTGAPTYTAITAGGKTLADAALTANASWPSGTVQWVDKDGKVLNPATTEVKANTAYQWKFTPDSKNYDPIEGSITFYYGSTGGGGSTTYPVSTPSKTENGSVSVSPKNASRGDTVTITVKPNDGYVLDDLAVTDKNGSDLKLTDKGNGKYSFTMPAGKVEVKASFAEEAETSPFADVATDAYCYDAVKWAAEQGITGGIGNNLFGPNQPCTRAQIVTFLWRAAGSPEPKDMSSFSDVPADSYYAKAVAWAVENGITTGTGDGKFSPDATCTRAQSVTFLFRAYKASADGMPAFRDVAANAYYAEAVKWATDNGITNGIGGGLFGPDNDCTRAQIVTFLYRSSQAK
mgnify:CR=1 FL=1